MGIIDSNLEEMYDVSILIGDTKDQKVHHNNPRIYGHYCPLDANPNISFSYTDGHEINREQYNNDLSGKLAPASNILDVTTRLCGIKLGVLNDFIISQEGSNVHS